MKNSIKAGFCLSENVKSENGETFVTEAVKCHKYDICQLLLVKGAKFDEENSNSETPLMIAATKNSKGFCKLLLKYGASIDQTSSNQGYSALIRAIQNDSAAETLPLVTFLVEQGADVNKRDVDGNTVLHHALHCSKQILNFLISRGANVNVVNNKGWTPLMLAFCRFECQPAFILAKAGADFSLGIASPWIFANAQLIKYLHKRGFSIQSTTLKGKQSKSKPIENSDSSLKIDLNVS